MPQILVETTFLRIIANCVHHTHHCVLTFTGHRYVSDGSVFNTCLFIKLFLNVFLSIFPLESSGRMTGLTWRSTSLSVLLKEVTLNWILNGVDRPGSPYVMINCSQKTIFMSLTPESYQESMKVTILDLWMFCLVYELKLLGFQHLMPGIT